MDIIKSALSLLFMLTQSEIAIQTYESVIELCQMRELNNRESPISSLLSSS